MQYANAPGIGADDLTARLALLSSRLVTNTAPGQPGVAQTVGLPHGGGQESYNLEDWDSGTDSDTASSCGDVDLTDLNDVPQLQAEQDLFWAMEHAKRRWRAYTRKPVRKVRRFFRRYMKGKGKGI